MNIISEWFEWLTSSDVQIDKLKMNDLLIIANIANAR